MVTLRSDPKVRTLADEFFRQANARQDAVLAGYPPETLDSFEELLRALTASLDE